MTPERLDEIQKRADAATKGPWIPFQVEGDTDWWVWKESALPYYGGVMNLGELPDIDTDGTVYAGSIGTAVICDGNAPEKEKADADFIAHARTDVPELVSEVRRMKDENEQLKLAKLELIEALTEARGLFKLGSVYSEPATIFAKNHAVTVSSGINAMIDAALAKHGTFQ